ncbi:SusE domain-containing protein [Paraflavitalea sp. CAU 1676]|uniref:SusE domain-containing protein n=1 Tax=Paraflavitalea sp. CAU 1676 TaxID=3032598 RepID=UPI0023DC8BD8|nr:SusE domain-containing protein [Paraflavitalea sp. CAU 1676]MDF2192580.1 SusE domain-containing protein [Paraflavitalea sp. CAU 1676]
MQIRNFYTTLTGCGLALLLATGCDKDYWTTDVETTITPVTVNAPANNVSLALDPLSNAVVNFEWSAAKTGNQTPVYYKVLFATEGGSFAKPVSSFIPTAMGTKNVLTLSHRDLNKVANAAGIKALAKGKVKWTVVASNGVASDTSKELRVLELERPGGFAENPAEVFITGAATEAGTDASKAIRLKKLSDGVFELYTSLDAGTYQFIDKVSGTPVSFVLDGALIKEGTAGNSPASSKTAYRINIDFNTATASLTEIQEVGLWFAGYNKVTQLLTYDAGGVWKAADLAIVFKQEAWGKDERYKFRVVEKDMSGNVKNVFQASATKDNGKPTSSTVASYWYFKSNDASQWDYTYKFEKEAPKADILVKFTGDNYTHQIVYK